MAILPEQMLYNKSLKIELKNSCLRRLLDHKME